MRMDFIFLITVLLSVTSEASTQCTQARRRHCVEGDCSDMRLVETRKCAPSSDDDMEIPPPPPQDSFELAAPPAMQFVAAEFGSLKILDIDQQTSWDLVSDGDEILSAAVDWNTGLVYYGTEFDIKRVRYDETNADSPSSQVTIIDTDQPVSAIAVDPKNELIVYALDTGEIYSVGYDADQTPALPIATACSSCVRGIALDIGNEMIYYTNMDTRTIQKVRYDNTDAGLLSDAHMDPTDVHLDLLGSGRLYWVGLNPDPATGSNVWEADLNTGIAEAVANINADLWGLDMRDTTLFMRTVHCSDGDCPLVSYDTVTKTSATYNGADLEKAGYGLAK